MKQRFRDAGWEGDGEIQLIWFPPFVDNSLGDCDGFYVWHVKQSNNGTSWLATPIELRFPALPEDQR